MAARGAVGGGEFVVDTASEGKDCFKRKRQDQPKHGDRPERFAEVVAKMPLARKLRRILSLADCASLDSSEQVDAGRAAVVPLFPD